MTKIKKEKSKDMTRFKVKNKNIANIRAIFEGKQILSLDKMKTSKGITLIALVITIVLNSSYLAMERMNKFEKI